MSSGRAVSFQGSPVSGCGMSVSGPVDWSFQATSPAPTTMSGNAILKNDAVMGVRRAERRSFDEKARCTTRKSVVQ